MVWFERPEEFDTEVLNALVEAKCGGELHEGIRGAPVWRSRDEHEAASERIAELTKVYDQRALEVDEPEWSDVAELLSMPSEARFGRISHPEAGLHYDVFAARNDRFGLVVTSQDAALHLRTFRRETPAEAIVAALRKRVRKPAAAAIRITRSALDEADENVGLRQPPPEVARLRQLTSLPSYLICEFHAECRNPTDGRRRSKRPLLLYGLGTDTDDAGCWTLQTEQHGGDTELHLAPADIHDVATRIEQLRRQLG